MPVLLEMISEEILDRIVNCLDSLPSLASLARVSKRFNRITLPHLYAHVSFIGGAIDMGTKNLRPFTVLLLQKPHLAALVQSITLRDSYATEALDRPFLEKPCWKDWPSDADLESIFTAAVQAHGVPDEESKRWVELLLNGSNEAAILALLLPVLVNLQSMDIAFDREWDGEGEQQSQFVMKMLQRAGEAVMVGGRPIFSKLADVIVPGRGDKYVSSGLCFER
jgi:hypothetical protein